MKIDVSRLHCSVKKGGEKITMLIETTGKVHICSEVPNKGVTFIIISWDFFLPT